MKNLEFLGYFKMYFFMNDHLERSILQELRSGSPWPH